MPQGLLRRRLFINSIQHSLFSEAITLKRKHISARPNRHVIRESGDDPAQEERLAHAVSNLLLHLKGIETIKKC